jgi:hypothetical protein
MNIGVKQGDNFIETETGPSQVGEVSIYTSAVIQMFFVFTT